MDVDGLVERLAAIANPHRLRILSALAEQPTHVSELARRLGLSRPLLYMHLRRLEEAGFLTGHLELSADGKALKYFDVVDFSLTIDVAAIVDAVARSPLKESDPSGGEAAGSSGPGTAGQPLT
ncbi:ArsR/SmtB family transcription factor [Hamadaea tsunoensis]|uniref:ArsR/SmtB family transcription factor n=1 Tax=Hamadaea tsunoensis TaxID=53368 RepID=UPI000423B951|nr:winged helix-turn-helix domain-containing protein [Hamadaea tsunoensis]